MCTFCKSVSTYFEELPFELPSLSEWIFPLVEHLNYSKMALLQNIGHCISRDLPKTECWSLTWWGGLCALMIMEALPFGTLVPGGFNHAGQVLGKEARPVATPSPPGDG